MMMQLYNIAMQDQGIAAEQTCSGEQTFKGRKPVCTAEYKATG